MLRNIFVLSLLVYTHLHLSAQYCVENRFTESDFFSEESIIVEQNIQYGMADIWYAGIPVPQLNAFDIAYPDPAIDPLEKKPLIVLAHGGGFWGGDKADLDTLIRQLAMEGFVAVSVNYRKGWIANGLEDCTGDAESLIEAIYKSMQDIRACLRYLIANAGTYEIDTANIFVGGESAGAFAAMNCIYISQDEWNGKYPDDQYIYGSLDNATNNIVADIHVSGFINMWGGLMDTNLANAGELKPTISFYGMADDVVPPVAGYYQNCENYTPMFGSETIDHLLTENSVCHALHSRPGYGHIAYSQLYVAGNVACFLKSLFCDACENYEVHYSEASCGELVSGETEIAAQETEELQIISDPAGQQVRILVPATGKGFEQLTLFDIAGRVIPASFTAEGNTIFADVQYLPAGMYFILLTDGTRSYSGRFVK